jgi:hypothetical protein
MGERALVGGADALAYAQHQQGLKLKKSVNDLTRLGADKNNKFAFAGKAIGSEGYVKKSNGIISIYHIESKGDEDGTGSQLHEVRHATQYLDGTMKFNSNDMLEHINIGNQINNEASAYSAQYAYSPHSLPYSMGQVNNVDDINLKYLGNIKGPNGEYLYPHLRQQYLFNSKHGN